VRDGLDVLQSLDQALGRELAGSPTALNERGQARDLHDAFSSMRGCDHEMPQTMREAICTMRAFVSPVLVTQAKVA
jgi:hypothetical protein